MNRLAGRSLLAPSPFQKCERIKERRAESLGVLSAVPRSTSTALL